MIEIANKLIIGRLIDLHNFSLEEDAIVHATQSIHYKLFGWNRTTNKPDKNHPNYIIYEENNRLSLNWVDGAAYLYKWSGPETFIRVLDFIERWIEKRRVFIHCDQGFSRSPTLGLLFLSKRLKIITNDEFFQAKEEFLSIYPRYNPGGIGDYVNMHWTDIN